MTFRDFQTHVERLQTSHPFCFQLDKDRPAISTEIEEVELMLNIKLPTQYLEFVSGYGGGYFAYAVVFSVQVGSEWNIVTRNVKAGIPGFIAVSDNGCGDYYGFKVVDRRCEDAIYFVDHEENYSRLQKVNDSFFEFLMKTALRA